MLTGDSASPAPRRAVLAATLVLAATAARGADGLEVVHAWIAPTERAGADVPLRMTVRNPAGEADALLRLRCPFAQFSEKVTVERGGEGPPARREIPQIAIKAAGETVLRPEGPHVMLLQTTRALAEGERHVCGATFRNAGKRDVAVEIRRDPPSPP